MPKKIYAYSLLLSISLSFISVAVNWKRGMSYYLTRGVIKLSLEDLA